MKSRNLFQFSKKITLKILIFLKLCAKPDLPGTGTRASRWTSAKMEATNVVRILCVPTMRAGTTVRAGSGTRRRDEIAPLRIAAPQTPVQLAQRQSSNNFLHFFFEIFTIFFYKIFTKFLHIIFFLGGFDIRCSKRK